MNGSELETRQSHADPRQADNDFFGPSLELTESEKMDLTAGDDSPYAKAIKKLMRKEITAARQEAVECDPADEKRQRALMTVAHAMDKFYKNVLGQVVFQKTSHFADVKLKIQQKDLEDRDNLHEIILHNQTH